MYMPSDQTTRDKKLILSSSYSFAWGGAYGRMASRRRLDRLITVKGPLHPRARSRPSHHLRSSTHAGLTGHVLGRKFHVLHRKKRGSGVWLVLKNRPRRSTQRNNPI